MPVFTVLQPSLRVCDPHTCTDSAAVRSLRGQLYEGLARYGAGGPEPALAEDWQCAPDARSWSFTLRAGARFHDGRPVRVADVIYSLRRAAAPEAAGELFTVTFHSYLADMELEGLVGGRLRLRTPQPMADLPELLCDMPLLPEGSLAHALPLGDLQSSAAALPPGTGPYLLSSAESNSVTLRGFEAHWGGRRRTAEVRLRAEPEEEARLQALQSGQAQLATELGPRSFSGLPPEGDCLPLRVPSSLCVIYLMRCDDGALADPRVRRALNHATDTQAIIDELLGGHAGRLNGPLSGQHFGHDPSLPPYRHDSARARELLRQSGCSGGLELAVHTPQRLPEEAPRLSRLLAEQWRSVGVSARVEHHEDRVEYARRIAEKRFGGLCCFDSSPLSTFRVLREKLDSRFAGPWWQHYHSDEANGLLSAAAATADPATRQGLYRRAYRIYHDEAPWLFLYQPYRLWALRREAAEAVSTDRQSLFRFR